MSGSDAVVDQKHTKAHQSLYDGFTCSWLARIQDDTSSKQADTISEGVEVTRLTEAVDLSVVCVGVRGQPVTFDQLQQVGDVQQKKQKKDRS